MFSKLRGKFGAVCIPMESTLRSIIEHQQADQPVIVFSLADQRPQRRSLSHWTRFLNQDTPVITGPEKIAKKFEMVTIFVAINRVRRGYYEVEFRVISEDPLHEPEFEITRKYLTILESIIRARPELYLWTHKRWKYHRNDFKNPVDIGP